MTDPTRPPHLDEDARAAVDLPVTASGLVAGAPGSGKTTLVVERVAALVAEGVSPDALLVLTPTRQAATALRDRLALRVGVATRGPLARSLSAFAFQIVRAAAVHRGSEPPQLLTGPDEDRILADLLAGDEEDEAAGIVRWPDTLPAEVRRTAGFRGEVRAFLAELQTLGLSPAALRERAASDDRPLWQALSSFAAEYFRVRDEMRGAHRDAAGLIREAVGLLRTLPAGSAALGDVAAVHAIVVDDAQELTLGGIELLEALRDRGVAVLAVGDPDVGSGSFRGARPENFARLADLGATHVLKGRHRGTAAQQSLVARVTERIGAVGIVAHRGPAAAVPDGDESVRAFVLRSTMEEASTIARLLRERHIFDGVPWGECAVIAHDSRQVRELARELAAREVPTTGARESRTFAEAPLTRSLLTLVDRAVRELSDWEQEDIDAVLVAAGLDAVDVRRVRSALRLTEDPAAPPRTTRDLLLSAFAHPVEFDVIDTREGRRAAKLARALSAIAENAAAGATAHELLWTAWEATGRAAEITQASRGSGALAERAREDLDDVVDLFQAAKRHGEREDGTTPIAFVRGLLESALAEDRLTAPVRTDVVRVLTPAAALGLDVDTIVVAGVQDGVWPNLRARGSLLETWRLSAGEDAEILDRRREAMSDELRLFVRAASRGRALTVITAVADDDNAPSVLFEFLPDPESAPASAAHPLSLRGLVAQHRRTLTSANIPAAEREHAARQLSLLAQADVPGAAPSQWYGVADITAVGGLERSGPARVSPSRLHSIEECALDWVITEISGATRAITAGVGTIIHAAVETAAGTDEESLWKVVEDRWGELEFDSAWRERAERKTARDLVRRLAIYLREMADAGTRIVRTEPAFEVALSSEEVSEGAVLRGVMDSVEESADGRITIVDLKTGKSEPQTDQKVADHPQLASYQLAFQRGALPELAGRELAGAKLLVLRPTAATKDYAVPTQATLTPEAQATFVARVADAVAAMRADGFDAPFEEHCRDDHTFGSCRIHTIGPVSSA